MSPQLLSLTNTLRQNKKRCQAGSGHCQSLNVTPQHMIKRINDPTMLPESEVVFRAVSPHGHVYWEIDPRANNIGTSDEDSSSKNVPTSSSDVSSSRQSSSRYSDSQPLILNGGSTASSSDSAPSPAHNNGGNILVNPFADVQLLSSAAPTNNSSAGTVANRGRLHGEGLSRFSSLRSGFSSASGNAGKSRRSQLLSSSSANASPAKDQQVSEQVQHQVQIRDLKSIPANVKSTDYILAKIQSHMARGSPVDIVATTAALNKGQDPTKQRKV